MARKRQPELQLLTLLAEGESVENVAAAVGKSPRTIYRRLAKPSFRRELGKFRARVIERSVAILAAGQVQAAVRLRQLAAQATSADVLDSIEKLSALHKAGVLTDEEFAATKAGLLRLLGARKVDESVQLRAAVKVLELGWKGVEHTDVQERLAALEERAREEETET